MADTLEELREKVATSCRILAMMGLVKEIFGHVSVRRPGTQEAFVRCRGAVGEGLPYTPVDLIQRLYKAVGPTLAVAMSSWRGELRRLVRLSGAAAIGGSRAIKPWWWLPACRCEEMLA